jgi:hypothetical protein
MQNDKIDALRLSCSPTTQEGRLRLKRAQIASSQLSPYLIDTVTVVAGGSGYLKGDYLQLAYGEPLLLVQVQSVTGDAVAAVTVISTPFASELPTIPVASLVGGATFRVTVKMNPAICCPCVPVTPVTLASIAVFDGGLAYQVGDILELPGGLLLLVTSCDSITNAVTGVSQQNSPTFSSAPTNPVASTNMTGSGNGALFDLSWT